MAEGEKSSKVLGKGWYCSSCRPAALYKKKIGTDG
jgi:hypothetical protein